MSTPTPLHRAVRDNLECASPDFWHGLSRRCDRELKRAIASGHCSRADRLWFLASVCSVRLGFIECHELMTIMEFKKAWDRFEQIELACRWLAQNAILDIDEFKISESAAMVREWQGLFPYRVFASPEFVINHEECSICGERVGPWSVCDHKVGKVYCGKFCSRIIRDLELKSVALVREPVQKYSVLIPTQEDGTDPMDYRKVAWVHERTSGPFSLWWSFDTTKVYPHTAFR